jgi:hypothetical protein
MELIIRKELQYVILKMCIFFTKIYGPWRNPLKFGMHDWWQILFVVKRLN